MTPDIDDDYGFSDDERTSYEDVAERADELLRLFDTTFTKPLPPRTYVPREPVQRMVPQAAQIPPAIRKSGPKFNICANLSLSAFPPTPTAAERIIMDPATARVTHDVRLMTASEFVYPDGHRSPIRGQRPRMDQQMIVY